jgi:GTP-binding protein
VPFSIVFTKADKLSALRLQTNVEAYSDKLKEIWEELPPIFITSSEKKQGREELVDYIGKIQSEMV